MAYSPSSPVTGATVSGLTSPTYTLTAMAAPAPTGTAHAVTALGGTQTGVAAHSIASPFTVTFWRPATYKSLSVVNPVTGMLQRIPYNKYRFTGQKGVIPLAGQPSVPIKWRLEIDVPAGSDTADANSIRALASFIGGLLWANGSGLADTYISGI